jgi:hypothetical protein
LIIIDPKGIQATEMVVSSKIDEPHPRALDRKTLGQGSISLEGYPKISNNQQTQQKSMFFMVLSPNHQLLILILM